MIPGTDPEKMNEGITPISKSEKVKNIEITKGKTRFNISSGKYIFTAPFVKI
jgi:hypothetical protein